MSGALFLSGCGFSRKNDSLFQIDVYSFPTTIDPQLAYDETALLIIENTFEGLLRRNQEGVLVEAAARDYARSADGITYTFYLRKACCGATERLPSLPTTLSTPFSGWPIRDSTPLCLQLQLYSEL